jgi:hypothetical protein
MTVGECRDVAEATVILLEGKGPAFYWAPDLSEESKIRAVTEILFTAELARSEATPGGIHEAGHS